MGGLLPEGHPVGGAEGPARIAGLSAGLTYAEAGVDIDAADKAVEAISELVAQTARVPGVIGGLGHFGGMFELPTGYRRPVLVASTDGVGTKMAVALSVGRLDTIGIDLVAMCADDLVCCGARPLFFLDYQLFGKLEPELARQVMVGIAEGAKQVGMAVIGGEMAEHPGLLPPGQVDVAGFAVGVVEKDRILDGRSSIQESDLVVGIASPGLRSNGYSLARRALLEEGGRRLEEPAWPGATVSLAEELLRPSVLYSPALLRLLDATSGVEVHALAHITGGGIGGNLSRVLPRHLDALIDPTCWEVPPIFAEIQRCGGVSDDEMARVFNLGVGMMAVVARHDADGAVELLRASGLKAQVVGSLAPGTGEVRFSGPLRLSPATG